MKSSGKDAKRKGRLWSELALRVEHWGRLESKDPIHGDNPHYIAPLHNT